MYVRMQYRYGTAMASFRGITELPLHQKTFQATALLFSRPPVANWQEKRSLYRLKV